MKKLIYILMAALMVLAAISCKKDNSGSNDNDGKAPVPEAVDIGLVVNGKTIKWASFNLGASKEYEYGNFYAWGETKPKSEYSWVTYSLANGYNDQLIAYCSKEQSSYWDYSSKPDGPDGDLTLFPTDDAAHVKLGGKWRMPTQEECTALLALRGDAENYKWEPWTFILDENGNEIRDANGNVVRGLRITQLSTGNSIFFPAAGNMENAALSNPGVHGYYWSSSIVPVVPDNAYALLFLSGNSYTDNRSRFRGLSIRPVCEE